jgi:glycosyltransferase involved in cell wall biosynthesis
VCTIHDLIPIDRPEWFNPRFAQWYQWLLPRLARRVQHIIAISEYTKQRVIERLRVPASKVTVIPNGVDERFSPRPADEIAAMRQALDLPAPYLLCVGSLEPRKNLPRLARRVAPHSKSVDRDLELVVAGAAG